MIEIGDTVKILSYNDNQVYTYTIKPTVLIPRPVWTGSHEGKRDNYVEEYVTTANVHDNEIGSHTPLAKAILGRRVGDVYSFIVDQNKNSGKILDVTKNRMH